MENIFEQVFDTREALLEALGNEVSETDGKFSVGGALRKTFEANGANIAESAKYRKRAQEAEAKTRELEAALGDVRAQLQEVLNMKPEELRGQLEEAAREKGRLKNQLEELTKTLEPLKAENASYKARENESKIVEALRQAAAELGVRAEAKRDVERLKTLFAVSEESGDILDANGRDVKSVVADELKLSPHWAPQSTGGGSTGSGSTGGAPSQSTAYDEARKRGDVAKMIAIEMGLDN